MMYPTAVTGGFFGYYPSSDVCHFLARSAEHVSRSQSLGMPLAMWLRNSPIYGGKGW